MASLSAEFEQGSMWDSRVLLLSVVLVILSFASTYEFELWEQTDRLFIPMLSAGVLLVIANIVARLRRPKLNVSLVRVDGESIEICPVKNLQFSGWVVLDKLAVAVSDIAIVRAHDFYNPGTGAGMYWVCIELQDRRVVEYNLDDRELVRDILDFFDAELPGIELDVDSTVRAKLKRPDSRNPVM